LGLACWLNQKQMNIICMEVKQPRECSLCCMSTVDDSNQCEFYMCSFVESLFASVVEMISDFNCQMVKACLPDDSNQW